jgi:hypothetical protein
MKDHSQEPRALANNPLDDVLENFYKPRAAAAARPARRGPVARRPLPPAKVKPTHYKIVCISLYVEDIARLESMVAELKSRGHSKANKSHPQQ